MFQNWQSCIHVRDEKDDEGDDTAVIANIWREIDRGRGVSKLAILHSREVRKMMIECFKR